MDTPDGMDPAEASFEMRRHLSARHGLPSGLSYLVPREELPGFHTSVHRARSPLAARLLVRKYLGERRRSRRAERVA